VATYVVPYRQGGKTRLGDPHLADAMMFDVVDACRGTGPSGVHVVRGGGGQGVAVARALARLLGPVTIVNADLPCATPEELEALTAAAPALVAAVDGTTNALAVRDAADFVPLYGAGSAERYERALGASQLELAGLANDVDTWVDLERIRDRVGTHTRRCLGARRRLRATA
jgi:2-phospho-L-lactate guanylyltransferase (CobY/MobA/RfbA family)